MGRGGRYGLPDMKGTPSSRHTVGYQMRGAGGFHDFTSRELMSREQLVILVHELGRGAFTYTGCTWLIGIYVRAVWIVP